MRQHLCRDHSFPFLIPSLCIESSFNSTKETTKASDLESKISIDPEVRLNALEMQSREYAFRQDNGDEALLADVHWQPNLAEQRLSSRPIGSSLLRLRIVRKAAGLTLYIRSSNNLSRRRFRDGVQDDHSQDAD